MAKLRGRGYASVNYPTGMNLGGDPSQALIHATTTGTFVVTLSSVDLGQGIKTIAAQCAAETLGLPIENVLVDTADTDTGPHCMGTFASRGTHRVGNAVIMAAAEARDVMLEVAAEELEVDAGGPGDRRHRLHQAQGRAGEEHPHHRPGTRRALQTRADDLRPRHLPQGAERRRCPRPGRWTPTPARRTRARPPSSRWTTRRGWSRCWSCTTRTRSAGRSTRQWRRSRSRAGPGWACRTPCSRPPSPTTRRATTGRATSPST